MSTDKPSFKVKYDVGTNFDPTLLDTIVEHNADGSFTTVFGKLKVDTFGGGRSSMILPDLTMDELKAYVDLVHSKGLHFNYLMNPYCIGNKDSFPSTHQELLAFIDQIAEMGVDGVTVNSPQICATIKRRHPQLEITIGLYTSIFTNKQVLEWKEIGADVLTVGHCLNRDFPLLESMLRLAKDIDIGIRLIANNICLRDCAYKTFHGTELAHSSQKNEKGAEFIIDYCVIQCTTRKLMNLEKLMASEWIRPEDVVAYERLCDKVGYDRLSIKLLDRIKSTEFIARVVKAYAERSYEGNLLDIMSYPGESKIKRSLEQNIATTMKYKFNPMDMMRMRGFFQLPDIYLDNKKLDGFLAPFINGYSCSERVCSSRDPDAEGVPGGCKYCAQWAEKAIVVDHDAVKEWGENAAQLIDSIQSSSIFTQNF